MKPTPLTDEQIMESGYNSGDPDGLLEFARAIEAARDAQWEDMLAGQEPIGKDAELCECFRPGAAPQPNNYDAVCMLSAASKSGDRGTVLLAAQLAGVAPCEKCGYVNSHCRCTEPAPVVQEPTLPEFFAELEYNAPDWDVFVAVYRRREDATPELVHREQLPSQPAEPVNKMLLEALKQIANWNTHTGTLAVDFGANGVRDFYRDIALSAIAAAEGEKE